MAERLETRLATIDYYIASDGPTLRIDVMERSELDVLRGMFMSLANRAVHEVIMDERGPIKARWYDVQSVQLIVVAKSPRKNVTKRAEKRFAKFEWVLDDEGWLECAERVDGLTGRSGHQYLSREVIDDALIVLAFGEGNPRAHGFSSILETFKGKNPTG